MTEHDRIDEKIYYQIHKIALKQKSYIAGHPNIFVMLNDIEESLKQPRRKLNAKKIKIITEKYCTICMNQEDFIKALCSPEADIWEE